MVQPEPNKSDKSADRLNQALVDDLKKRELIQNPAIEAAFRAVLRHHFLPGTPLEQAYTDRAIAAKQDKDGQWLSSSSQPSMMAIMLEQLDLQPGHKILEIGTGSGYNAALMAQIVGEAGRVVSVEIEDDLVQAAREHLATTGFEHVQVVHADGCYGYPDAAPFDRIILTVGAPDIAPAWWEQMTPNGRLVLPLMLKGSMKSIAFAQVHDHLESKSVQDCGFIQLRGDFASIFSDPIQLGTDPNLFIEPIDAFPLDGDAAYELLTGENRDWAVHVEAQAWDVLFGNLWTWLSLREQHLCKLVARGEMVDRNLVPPLSVLGGSRKVAGTAALADRTCLAALMRPPDQPIPPATVDQPFPADLPFPLFVRQFGSSDSMTQRFIAQIQAWDAAGRPPSDSMRIRAYPKEYKYLPSEGEFVIEKQWTKLIVEWRASALHSTNPEIRQG